MKNTKKNRFKFIKSDKGCSACDLFKSKKCQKDFIPFIKPRSCTFPVMGIFRRAK